jgi:HSP20 family protein
MGEEGPDRGAPDMPSAWETMNRLWRTFMQQSPRGAGSQGLWHPLVDVYDRPDEIVVELELPGMKGQHMDVSLEQEHLIIEGSRSRRQDYDEKEGYYRERPMGPFHRVIHLPCAVDEDAIAAQYGDGLLTVRLPKAGREKARRIPIS